MLDLSELVFKVNTKELDDAAQKISGLGTAVSKLNRPLDKMSQDADKAAISTAKVAEAQAKATAAVAKAEAAQARANRTIEASTAAQTRSATVFQRQSDILEFMTQGFSKGQASVLQQAKAAGTLTEEMLKLQQVLLTQRKLQGGDPFDKSTSGLIALKNQYGEIREAIRQYNADSGLTSKQTRELARDKERLIEKLKHEGASFSEIKAAVRDHNRAYTETAQKVNALINAEKELERQHRESANATRALAREDEKLESILNTMTLGTNVNAKTSERAAQSIAQYARNLRLAGITGTEAAMRLEAYRQKVIAVQRTEEKRKVDYLSRSLAPQISDVTVSLAGGMNPLTVLLQQGLQIRDMIGQSGVAAEQLQVAFRNAASDMIRSIRSTAGALGSLFIGTLADAGRAVGSLGTSIFGLDKALAAVRNRLLAANGLMGETPKMVRQLDNALKVMAVSGGVGIFALVGALGALALGFIKVIKEENALSIAMAKTGAAFALNRDRAYEVANSMNTVGINTTKAIGALTEISKHSGLANQDMRMLIKSAIDMEKYAGVAVEDTAKAFADMAGKPLESLVKLGVETGRVTPEVIKLVAELERQGKTSEAAAIAVRELAKVNKMTTDQIESDYGTLMTALGGVKSFFSGIWDAILGVGRQETLEDRLKKAQENLLSAEAKAQVNPNDRRIAKYVESEKANVEALREQVRLRQLSLSRQADQARLAGIAGEWEERNTKNMSDKVKQENEINKIRAQGLALGKSQAEIEKQISDYKEKNKKSAPKKPEEDRFFDRALKQLKNDSIEAAFAQDELTDSQLRMLKVIQDPLWNKLDEDQKIRLLNVFKEAYANEELNRVLEMQKEARKAAQKEDFELMAERLEAMHKFDILSREANITLAEESAEIEFQRTLIGRTTEERMKAIEIRKVEIALAKELAEIEATYKDEPLTMKKRMEEAAQRAAIRIKNITARIAVDAAQDLQTKLSDAVETALFEGASAGAKSLRAIIVSELKKPFRIWIEAFVSRITGGAGSIMGMDSGGGSIASIAQSGGMSTLNIMSLVKNTYNTLSGAFTWLGDSVAFMAQDVGAWLVNNTTGYLNQAGSALMQSADMLGSASSALAGAAAGMLIGSLISGSYSALTKDPNVLVAIGTAIGSIFGPWGAAIGGAIGGVVNRMFGRAPAKVVDQGVEGTFSTSGADVHGYTQTLAKGGWFKKDKWNTITNQLPTELTDMLSAGLRAVTLSVGAYASSLGLQADRILGFTKHIRLNLLGLNDEQISQAFTDAIGGFGNDMAALFAAELAPVLQRGETWMDGLTRLATALNNVNAILDTLNVALLQSSVIGGDAASKLIAVFGDLEKMTEATTAYYQAFYTEQERVAITTRQLTAAFATMGMTLPATYAEYRALVEAQDLYTDSGRATYAALINLAPAFDAIKKATEALANSLLEEVKRLRGAIAGSSGQSGLAYLQGEFARQTGLARGGDQKAIELLPELSKAIEEAYKLQARSSTDVIRMQAQLAMSLQETALALGIPMFAAGGTHTGGARIVGENGPELEVTGPSRIYSAGQTASMLGGDTAEILQRVNENISGLRIEMRADVIANAKTAKLLDRVMPSGDAINIVGSIDGDTD